MGKIKNFFGTIPIKVEIHQDGKVLAYWDEIDLHPGDQIKIEGLEINVKANMEGDHGGL